MEIELWRIYMEENLKQLLLKDLCARLPYGVIVKYCSREGDGDIKLGFGNIGYVFQLGNGWWKECKPYLRTMSSMTEEEATKVAELHGFKDILSISVNQDYISVEIDDGVAGSEIHTIWFNEIVSSIEVLDFLNTHQFDYRGLIPMGLALEALKDMYK